MTSPGVTASAGGLVPGVTVYGYAAHAVLQALGPGWVERGGARLRFLSPVLRRRGAGRVRRPGSECRGVRRFLVKGRAWRARPPFPTPSRVAARSAAIPRRRPPNRRTGPGRVRTRWYRAPCSARLPLATDAATAAAYLTRIAEPSRLYAEEGIVHPGLLLEGANRVLMANVVLPAWLHVESEMRHLRAVSVGEDVEVRARVAELFERKGHHFVRLDVVWLAGAEPVAAAQHTAIWQLAGS